MSGCFDSDIFYGGAYLGGPIRGVKDARTCQVYCQLDDRCQAFSLTNRNVCRLKKLVGKKKPKVRYKTRLT